MKTLIIVALLAASIGAQAKDVYIMDGKTVGKREALQAAFADPQKEILFVRYYKVRPNDTGNLVKDGEANQEQLTSIKSSLE